MRFELMTSSLPRRRSTPELRGHWSGRRDSNSRPSAWKADALPTELHPPVKPLPLANFQLPIETPGSRWDPIGNRQLEIGNAPLVQGVGFEPT
jgi:hypothetical protein